MCRRARRCDVGTDHAQPRLVRLDERVRVVGHRPRLDRAATIATSAIVRGPSSYLRRPLARASTPDRPVQSSTNGRRRGSTRRVRAGDRVRSSTPARAASSSSTASSTSVSTCHPRAPSANISTRGSRLPHHTVLPVERMNRRARSRRSRQSRRTAWQQLGGSDTASRASAGGRVTRRTEWPQVASNRAALDPAGPPPSTTTS